MVCCGTTKSPLGAGYNVVLTGISTMKLPEYDNRQAGQSLYDHKDDHSKGNFKFPAMFFGLPTLLIACVALAIYALLN
jgi:hypothetical protein